MTSVPLAPGILGQLARNSTAAPPALFLWPVSCLRFQRLHLPSQVIHSLAPPSSYGNLLCWRHLCPDCAKTWAQNNAHPIADPDLPRAILLLLPLLCGVSTYLCIFMLPWTSHSRNCALSVHHPQSCHVAPAPSSEPTSGSQGVDICKFSTAVVNFCGVLYLIFINLISVWIQTNRESVKICLVFDFSKLLHLIVNLDSRRPVASSIA